MQKSLTGSVAIRKTKVHSQTSRSKLHPDGKTVSREIKKKLY